MGAPDDESKLILERVRAGEAVSDRDLRALLHNRTREGVMALLGAASVPEGERGLLFLRDILRHDEEARQTLAHYQLVREGDKSPPDTETALAELFDDLKDNPAHVKAIKQMRKPVLQLMPIYDHEDGGLYRIADAINNHHQREFHGEYFHAGIDSGYTADSGWGRPTITPGKIIGWQVVVVEGAKVLPRKINRNDHRPMHQQISRFKANAKKRSLQLCNPKMYFLLQMQAMRQADPDTPLEQLGIDPRDYTLLDLDLEVFPHLSSGVPRGYWSRGPYIYSQTSSNFDSADARIRSAVVVKKIL